MPSTALSGAVVEGRMAFIEWTVESEDRRVDEGADSFLIEDGWASVQTIHYSIRDSAGRVLIAADGTRQGRPASPPSRS
ncbi:MAG: hypothetical protein ACRDQT_11835 [Gaiellaceae bacterium]